MQNWCSANTWYSFKAVEFTFLIAAHWDMSDSVKRQKVCQKRNMKVPIHLIVFYLLFFLLEHDTFYALIMMHIS
jgi:hypothetical protein